MTPEEKIGRALADSLFASHDATDSSAFAKEFRLDPKGFAVEILYLDIFLTDFVVTMRLGQATPARATILSTFYGRLAEEANDWEVVTAEMRRRFVDYQDAVREPHPTWGIPYSLGRAFARQCEQPDDIAVIAFGAELVGAQMKMLSEAISADSQPT